MSLARIILKIIGDGELTQAQIKDLLPPAFDRQNISDCLTSMEARGKLKARRVPRVRPYGPKEVKAFSCCVQS